MYGTVLQLSLESDKQVDERRDELRPTAWLLSHFLTLTSLFDPISLPNCAKNTRLGSVQTAVNDPVRVCLLNSTLIQDSMAELAMYKDDLQTKLTPYTQQAAERFGKDLQLLAERLGGHMTDAREQMENYLQELQTMVEQNADDVKARVSTYTRKLRKRLQKDTQDIQR